MISNISYMFILGNREDWLLDGVLFGKWIGLTICANFGKRERKRVEANVFKKILGNDDFICLYGCNISGRKALKRLKTQNYSKKF